LDVKCAPTVEFVGLKPQYSRLRGEIGVRIQRVLDHGQFILGPEVAELEERLAETVDVSQCVTVSSGTDALLIALMTLDVGPGDEVITSPFTFIATGEVIAMLGATPVFVDIDRRTYNIDPLQIEAAITERTKAIIPVSLFGQCAEFDPINEVAARNNVPVIEDAAQSFGGSYRGRSSCGLTAIAAASFFPTKPLGCYGDGGALFFEDAELANAARDLRVHGQERRYFHTRVGINGRMDTLQAAVLLAKLDLFEDEMGMRERIGQRYSTLILEAFRDVDPKNLVSPPHVEPHNRSVYAQFTVEVYNRDAVQAAMSDRGIPTSIHYPMPLHLQPIFRALGRGPGSYPSAEAAAACVLSLPMHPYLTEGEQVQVIAALKESVDAC
jgi:UDP-2-acetamido-2-deoxy-ribo-hexuluronate aminotransferase